MKDKLPFKRGDFVWCNFPFEEAPRKPGQRHVALNLGPVVSASGKIWANVIYTTTNPRSQERHYARVNDPEARSMGQRPFTIDASRAAHLPPTTAFFPDLEKQGRGIVGHASQDIQRAVLQKKVDCDKPGATTPSRVYGPESTLPARPAKPAEKPASEKPSRGQSILEELKARPSGLEAARAERRAKANAGKPTLSLRPRKKGPGIAD